MREEEISFCHFLFLFPFLLFISMFIFSKPSFAGNFCSTPFFLVVRCVFCIFTLVYMLSLDGCWWGLFQIIRNVLLSEFMFNWDGISRFEAVFWYVWKNREVQKTEHLEHAWVPNILGLIQMCLHFYDIFYR